MTPQEFKAWFDGFTEAFTGVPTKAQWVRVKERVAEIDGRPVTERIFIDRYWPTYPSRYWGQGLAYYNAVGIASNTTTIPCNATYQQALSGGAFNSTAAMNALGRADAQALT